MPRINFFGLARSAAASGADPVANASEAAARPLPVSYEDARTALIADIEIILRRVATNDLRSLEGIDPSARPEVLTMLREATIPGYDAAATADRILAGLSADGTRFEFHERGTHTAACLLALPPAGWDALQLCAKAKGAKGIERVSMRLEFAQASRQWVIGWNQLSSLKHVTVLASPGVRKFDFSDLFLFERRPGRAHKPVFDLWQRGTVVEGGNDFRPSAAGFLVRRRCTLSDLDEREFDKGWGVPSLPGGNLAQERADALMALVLKAFRLAESSENDDELDLEDPTFRRAAEALNALLELVREPADQQRCLARLGVDLMEVLTDLVDSISGEGEERGANDAQWLVTNLEEKLRIHGVPLPHFKPLARAALEMAPPSQWARSFVVLRHARDRNTVEANVDQILAPLTRPHHSRIDADRDLQIVLSELELRSLKREGFDVAEPLLFTCAKLVPESPLPAWMVNRNCNIRYRLARILSSPHLHERHKDSLLAAVHDNCPAALRAVDRGNPGVAAAMVMGVFDAGGGAAAVSRRLALLGVHPGEVAQELDDLKNPQDREWARSLSNEITVHLSVLPPLTNPSGSPLRFRNGHLPPPPPVVINVDDALAGRDVRDDAAAFMEFAMNLREGQHLIWSCVREGVQHFQNVTVGTFDHGRGEYEFYTDTPLEAEDLGEGHLISFDAEGLKRHFEEGLIHDPQSGVRFRGAVVNADRRQGPPGQAGWHWD